MTKWQVTRLDQCARIVGGSTPKTSVKDYWDGEIYWATPKDLSNLESPNLEGTPRRITKAGLDSCGAEVLPEGSVLFSSRAPIGHVAINCVPMATNQGFKSFVPDPEKLDAKFLYYWLRKNRTFFNSLGNGATFKEVSKAIVSRIEIPLPPIAQQKRIAAILDRAEELRGLRRQALAALDAIAQSIFLEMFGNPTDNPHQFPIKRLIEIVDPNRPISYGILMPGADQDSGVLYVRVVDMKDGGIELANIRRTTPEISNAYRRSLLKPYDVLLSIRGHVGRLAIVPSALNAANITQDTARLAIKDAEPTFVCECLRTASFQRWMVKHTKGVAVRGINLGDVKQMPIILPPLNLQQEFARRVEAIEQLKTTHRESLAQLDALFASLQHRAFRGELSP